MFVQNKNCCIHKVYKSVGQKELNSNRIRGRLNCHYMFMYFEYVQTKYVKYVHVTHNRVTIVHLTHNCLTIVQLTKNRATIEEFVHLTNYRATIVEYVHVTAIVERLLKMFMRLTIVRRKKLFISRGSQHFFVCQSEITK